MTTNREKFIKLLEDYLVMAVNCENDKQIALDVRELRRALLELEIAATSESSLVFMGCVRQSTENSE